MTEPNPSSYLYGCISLPQLKGRVPGKTGITAQEVSQLLSGNPQKYQRNVADIHRKLEKPILLDNPESKRLKKAKRHRIDCTVLRSAARRTAKDEAFAKLTFGDLLPLHRLWEGYMREVIGSTQRPNLENALLRADYHGGYLRVIQSRCPSMVGREGLVVQETMQTFNLLTQEGKPLIIPKSGNIFECSLRLNANDASGINTDERKFTWRLYGNQLCQHSGLRSSKKFKSKNTVNL